MTGARAIFNDPERGEGGGGGSGKGMGGRGVQDPLSAPCPHCHKRKIRREGAQGGGNHAVGGDGKMCGKSGKMRSFLKAKKIWIFFRPKG